MKLAKYTGLKARVAMAAAAAGLAHEQSPDCAGFTALTPAGVIHPLES